MKLCKAKTSSRRKMRKMHFSAPAGLKRKIMSATLSKELRELHKTRSLPVKRDDEVCVLTGHNEGREGKVIKINRKKFKIYIDKIAKDRQSGEARLVGIHPSNVVITKLKMDQSRRKILARKEKGKM